MHITQHLDNVKKYINSCVKNNQDREDILQDTLLYVLTNQHKYKITNYKGFILNSAKFFIYKYYNKKINIDFTSDIKDEASDEIIEDHLIESINCISKLLIRPFLLQLEGESIDNISVILKTNPNTIKTRIKRCKEQLKEEIKKRTS